MRRSKGQASGNLFRIGAPRGKPQIALGPFEAIEDSASAAIRRIGLGSCNESPSAKDQPRRRFSNCDRGPVPARRLISSRWALMLRHPITTIAAIRPTRRK
jgi:hypothetical protein